MSEAGAQTKQDLHRSRLAARAAALVDMGVDSRVARAQAIDELNRAAWRARQAGATWAAIGDALGLSRERARQRALSGERAVKYGRGSPLQQLCDEPVLTGAMRRLGNMYRVQMLQDRRAFERLAAKYGWPIAPPVVAPQPATQ